jgi:signal transduction histidine kinase
VVAEYRALRASVLWLWSETIPTKEERDLEEVIRFDETIDQAIAEVTQRFADRATRYSDYFLGVLAHDVRNPLHLIKLAAEHLLIDGARKETRTDDASRIIRGVRRIERLVNDLAVLVRHRVNQPVPLTKTNLDLGVICEEALEEAKASHVDVVFEVQRRGDLTGNWDRERLPEVVSNLTVNAVVHASAKRVDLKVEDQGPFVILKVTNRGSPIPADMPESIFEPLVYHHHQTLANHQRDSVWDSSSCAKSQKRMAGQFASAPPHRKVPPFLCVCRDDGGHDHRSTVPGLNLNPS